MQKNLDDLVIQNKKLKSQNIELNKNSKSTDIQSLQRQ